MHSGEEFLLALNDKCYCEYFSQKRNKKHTGFQVYFGWKCRLQKQKSPNISCIPYFLEQFPVFYLFPPLNSFPLFESFYKLVSSLEQFPPLNSFPLVFITYQHTESNFVFFLENAVPTIMNSPITINLTLLNYQ